ASYCSLRRQRTVTTRKATQRSNPTTQRVAGCPALLAARGASRRAILGPLEPRAHRVRAPAGREPRPTAVLGSSEWDKKDTLCSNPAPLQPRLSLPAGVAVAGTNGHGWPFESRCARTAHRDVPVRD